MLRLWSESLGYFLWLRHNVSLSVLPLLQSDTNANNSQELCDNHDICCIASFPDTQHYFFSKSGKNNVKNIQLETRLSAKDFHYGC